MSPRRPAVLIVLAALLLLTRAAAAQQTSQSDQSDQSDPLDAAMIRMGSLGINPTFLVHDIGRDDNVFNDSVDPKSDFTFTLSPKAEVLFRPQFVHLDYVAASDYVYYQTYASQRSTNVSSSIRAEFELGRLQPFVTLDGAVSSNRLNEEVDARARHHQTTYGTGVAAKIATRTSVTVGVRRSDLTYDAGSTFRGTDLGTALDDRLEGVDVSGTVELTPFTKASVTVTREEQRFTFTPDRDANLFRIAPTLSFGAQAILRGTASVGYGRLSPISSTLPPWSGVTALVTLGTTVLGRYDLEGTLSREPQYSYDLVTPYYILTGGTLTVTVAIIGPFDVKATGTEQVMSYRSEATGAVVPNTIGSDTYESYGGGVGYKIRDRVRLGMNADWSNRASELSLDRTYHNRRIYASLTWGAQQ